MHVVSLLNSNLDDANGEKLVLNVLKTLTCLLASNDASKVLISLNYFCCLFTFFFHLYFINVNFVINCEICSK